VETGDREDLYSQESQGGSKSVNRPQKGEASRNCSAACAENQTKKGGKIKVRNEERPAEEVKTKKKESRLKKPRRNKGKQGRKM